MGNRNPKGQGPPEDLKGKGEREDWGSVKSAQVDGVAVRGKARERRYAQPGLSEGLKTAVAQFQIRDDEAIEKGGSKES